MTDPIDIAERLAGLSADHGPDGWPAVQMRDISALCDEVARLRAALAAQVLQWLPMDSVPKDGRRVLVAIEGVDRAVVAMWNGGVWETVDGNCWTGRAITRWMPLPAAHGASPQPPQQGREGWGAPNARLSGGPPGPSALNRQLGITFSEARKHEHDNND